MNAASSTAGLGWPFHAGEREAQRRAGSSSAGGGIRHVMPDQHRQFFAALPFVIAATADASGPVATLWAGAAGFVRSPDDRTLQIATARDLADPASAAFDAGAPIGVLGIEFATRRRNRANGRIAAADPAGLTVAVHQSFGNCPSYIHPRELSPAPASPEPTERFAGLDRDAAAAIARADTFFVATAAYADQPTGGVDVSHRGGPPGFVQVTGDLLTIPDYRGNRYFNTLGNLVSDPRAALVFVDFIRGDVLHVQGTVEIMWDGPAVDAQGGAERLWRVHVARGWRRRGALALREAETLTDPAGVAVIPAHPTLPDGAEADPRA